MRPSVNVLTASYTYAPHHPPQQILVQYVKESTTELKDYCNKTLNGLRANIPKEEVEPLIKVRMKPLFFNPHAVLESSGRSACIQTA
jgi:hypothetical protein